MPYGGDLLLGWHMILQNKAQKMARINNGQGDNRG
jgi:hypothetical protein